ncbi:LicD family protein [Anaerosacchariphilus sp. NSJ-68]|uniref:LicD family protein n=2 Tax=Lachnospiraceae TaxID=186803 RepID=A0A923RL16_9FIRM|nr:MULTISPECIES: LicD family protein [Lachnospiraceae]MBC5658718.1 LicD family protein [Anaerosacchariphilus hominis]MBC5699013.1 LicD family protein [Roseburia difficilis]
MDREKLINVQLEILDEIKRVCEKNGIQFFLDYGTLLGAVRHKGMIPWDDDIDLGMLRKDYDRFCAVAPKELGKNFYLQTWENDIGYACPFVKVRRLHTHFIERATENTGQEDGIFIDVFPYDTYPATKLKRICQKYGIKVIDKLLYAKCGYILWEDRDTTKKRLYKVLGKISNIISKKTLCKCRAKLELIGNKDNTGYYIVQSGDGQYERYKVPKKCLEKGCIELEFENKMYPCPSDYDTWLTCFYGDYKKLPPESERVSMHNVKNIVIEGKSI